KPRQQLEHLESKRMRRGHAGVGSGVEPKGGGHRQLHDHVRAGRAGVSETKVAAANAHRIDQGHVHRHRSLDRARGSPRLVAPDRRRAGDHVKGIFGAVVALAFEYEPSGGDYNLRAGALPMPLCMVAYVLDEHLRHVRTVRMWREELLASPRPPFDVGDDAVFVAYAAWAELTCFKMLGWPFPRHVLDLHTAYLAGKNILPPYDPDERRSRPRKDLASACKAYGIAGWENIDKSEIAKDIGEGRWRKYGV